MPEPACAEDLQPDLETAPGELRSGPKGWPIGQSIPKLRTEAPRARGPRSSTMTLRLRRASW